MVQIHAMISMFNLAQILQRLGSPLLVQKHPHQQMDLCKFSAFAMGAEEYAMQYSAMTGVPFTTDDVLKTGERIYNLMRAFCVREGINRDQDTLPGRLLEDPLPAGPAEGMVIERDTTSREARSLADGA